MTHELLGREVEKNALLLAEYRKLLNLVERIRSGEVDPKHVTITTDAWTIDTTPKE